MQRVRIQVRVQPGSSRSQVVGWDGEVLRVRVQAPPVEGRANEALVELLAGALRLPKRDIVIERGAGGRQKLVAIIGLNAAQVRDRLARDSAASG